MTSTYPQIDVAGSPFEMGLSHGLQLRDRVHRTAEAMRAIIGEEAYDAGWAALQPSLEYGRQHAPHLIEEMRGIAAGADIGFSDVYRINAHLDLSVWKDCVWSEEARKPIPGCSSHAVTTESEVLLGWNGDDDGTWMECGAVVRGHPDAGEPFIYWSLAGSVGRPGMNRHVAVGANSIGSRWSERGLLYPMMARMFLGCRSTHEALEVATRYQACARMNYMIADANGDLADLEVEPDGFAVLRPADQGTPGYLLHTNSVLDTGLAGELVDLDRVCRRLGAARRLYRRRRPADSGAVFAILADHTGGICEHADNSQTIVSFVAEIRAGRFQVTLGNPCTASAATYWLN